MTKPYTEEDLSNIFDEDLIWRRKELSDLKAAVNASDAAAKLALLRAIIAMSYAHWEGYVRTCATRYFEHLTMRRWPYVHSNGKSTSIHFLCGSMLSIRAGQAFR